MSDIIWIPCQTGRIWVSRLQPGSDLRKEIQRWAAENMIEASVILSAVGSLSTVAIRLAGAHSTFVDSRPWELLSLQGTVNSASIHLHITVADNQGHTTGGHLMNGSIVRTTIELAVQEINGVRFDRDTDPSTGFRELQINRL